MSSYDPRILFSQAFQPAPNTLQDSQDIEKEKQRKALELKQAQEATRASDQTYQYNEAVHPAMITQQANLAERGGLENRGLIAGLPVKQLEGKQAGIESGYLDQIFPGQQQSPSLPPQYQSGPPMSRESDAQQAQIPPAAQNQFASKSLAELRQLKAGAGPTGEFLGKFIDPIINQKSLQEEVLPAIQELSQVANMAGGKKEDARAKAAAIAAIENKYPMVVDNPKFKEVKASVMPKDTDFNPAVMMGVNNRLVGPFLTDWRDSRTKYETQYGQPFLQIQGIKNSKAYGTSLGDQSMIDKLIIMETGTKPTEAQYANLSQKIGFADMFDIAAGKFKQGQQLSSKMRKSLESEIEEQARIGHQAYTENMAQAKEEARLNGLDPESVIRPGGSFGQVDAHMKRTAKPESPVAAKPATKAEFDALPSGTLWTDSKGETQRKK